jgi:hypothetical protein
MAGFPLPTLPSPQIPGLSGLLSNQELRPIVFILIGGGIPIPIPFGVPFIGMVRPEHISYERRSRGQVIGTYDSAFLEDFGQGVTQITLSGSTGLNETILSGLPGMKLIEAVFIEYLERRKRISDSGGDPNVVTLLLIDTLNAEAFKVYPHEFVLEKTRQRPFLYFYRMRLSALQDALQDFVYGVLSDFLTSAPTQSGVLNSVGQDLNGAVA